MVRDMQLKECPNLECPNLECPNLEFRIKNPVYQN